MSNIVVFGGSFDPIHNGHIRICEAAAKKYNASILFVPTKAPRWKNPEETSNQRLEMLKRALSNVNFQYEICDYELNSEAEVNYSIDTVNFLLKKYCDDKLFFLIGADEVNLFPKWKDAESLAKKVKIIYSNRPDIELNNKIIKDYNMESINFLESGEVSSSAVKEMKSVDLPFEVLKYIEDNRLYFVKKLATFLPEKRLNHSIEVANLTLKVAKVNGLAPLDKYYFAALFHDLGKTYHKDDMTIKDLMEKYYPEYLDIPNFAHHQFVGEFLAKKYFGIEDPEILDAIKFHCTGKANMTKLGMMVYACDKIEPTREFDSTWLINACLENWKNGFLTTLKDNKKYLLEHNKDISNRLTDECFEMYLK